MEIDELIKKMNDLQDKIDAETDPGEMVDALPDELDPLFEELGRMYFYSL